MSVTRGVAFSFARPTRHAVAAVVLTNDTWNDRMRDVGVVPLVPPSAGDGPLSPIVASSMQALPGQLLSLPQDVLGQPLEVLAADQLSRIEDALCRVLGLAHVLGDPPRSPPVPGGAITYPRWGDIYNVAHASYAGEHKRYVVVSEDRWNARAKTVIAVRTTTQIKHAHASFPHIQRGIAQACCGDATSFLASRFELNRTFMPQRLTTTDMRAVATGLVQTHGLEAAIARLQLNRDHR
jgi:mRNA-degrading endonuclease toxin of MazEF toxin-antitoxin module